MCSTTTSDVVSTEDCRSLRSKACISGLFWISDEGVCGGGGVVATYRTGFMRGEQIFVFLFCAELVGCCVRGVLLLLC